MSWTKEKKYIDICYIYIYIYIYKNELIKILLNLGIVLGEQALDLLSVVGMDSHQVLYLFRGRWDPTH